MEFTIVIVGVLLALYLRSELKRIEVRLCGVDDHSHDASVDASVIEATQSYRNHRDKLVREKQELPGINLWDISSNRDWKEQLNAKAEILRPLAEEAYGNSPDTPHFMYRLGQMPMTYNLAHALVAFATLRKGLAIKSAEWAIMKIELLGLMRKRGARLEQIAEADRDLRELEREMEGCRAESRAGGRQSAMQFSRRCERRRLIESRNFWAYSLGLSRDTYCFAIDPT